MNPLSETFGMSVDERQEVLNICVQYLGQEWKTSRPENILIKKFNCGLANRKYYCALLSDVKEGQVDQGSTDHRDQCPKEVVVHLNGRNKGDTQSWINLIGPSAETVILSRLSNFGLAPKLYGVFEGGRVEEYIPSKNATFITARNSKMIEAIATKLARLHSIDQPISKELDRVQRFLKLFSNYEKPKISSERSSLVQLVDQIFEFPFVDELHWFESFANKYFATRPVFSHTDLILMNILIREDKDNEPVIIDYEASGYYYRGYDLAVFLLMRKTEFGFNQDNCYFNVIEDPEADQIDTLFLESYLKEWTSSAKLVDSKVDTLDHLRQEVNFFTLLHYLFLIGIIRRVLPMSLDSNFGTLSEQQEVYFRNIAQLCIEPFNTGKQIAIEQLSKL